MTTFEQRSITPPGVPPAPTHNRILFSVAGVEMWERFSFYGMQAIMLYYLYHSATDGGLGLDRAEATALMGAYGSLVYLCTLAGGWVADRLAGAEKTLLGGALTLVVGHLALALVPGVPGVTAGLLAVAVGSGALKASAITVLGTAFADDEGKRDAGFQIFYLGINIGALLGPILTGWFQTTRGFHYGFGAAAVLMLIGLGNYLLTRSRSIASAPTDPLPRTALPRLAAILASASLLILLAVVTGTLNTGSAADILLAVTLGSAALLFTRMLRDRSLGDVERRKVVAFIPVFLASTAFWAVLNQTYGVFAVYSDLRLDRTVDIFGAVREVPASWTQSLNPAFILILSGPAALLWTALGDRVGSATKMAVGVIISGCGLLVLLPFAGGGPSSTPFLALATAVLVITCGELLVGPVGMSTTTALAPASYGTRFSALYFLTMAAGTAAAGVVSRLYNPEDATSERIYFTACGLTVITVGAVVLGMVRRINRLAQTETTAG
ncbi:peptide MFS transporter [Corynebacterium pygosceleis]|uniref:peptide MFS transporter n=1 Tax=Corynebacterium pygosceleis TaxID=2800406 RepID=UPI001905D6C6|nr:oligopeptide:H+ symporter [Corynebacterium pygosceleis]MCK7674598.1 oligopeptide:H+ symporter [Corynebacterium pygosceleis]MCL0120100.1 oligopeptide:H+ symporter [Corynebacterium pygosceleis]